MDASLEGMLRGLDELRAAREELLEVSVRKGTGGGDEFTVSAEIGVPAAEVYALIDLADERNKWRQMGDSVTALDSEGRRFRLIHSYMRDVAFDIEVEEALKPNVYTSRCTPMPPIGHLERSRECYRIETLEGGRCAVTYTMTAYFEAGLDEWDSEAAIRMMTAASHNAMAKLKANAEHGVGTIEAFNATRLMQA
jgi:hypothetical protein